MAVQARLAILQMWHRNSGRTVGEKVQVRRGDSVIGGTIVEDFTDSLIPGDRLGRDWVPRHRWAIALDTGVLVFVDDSDLDDRDFFAAG